MKLVGVDEESFANAVYQVEEMFEKGIEASAAEVYINLLNLLCGYSSAQKETIVRRWILDDNFGKNGLDYKVSDNFSVKIPTAEILYEFIKAMSLQGKECG